MSEAEESSVDEVEDVDSLPPLDVLLELLELLDPALLRRLFPWYARPFPSIVTLCHVLRSGNGLRESCAAPPGPRRRF
ncbi:hypothetical protein [Streptomyces sp. SD31]|uniref:hypothetical protein n=1 Tax=Streptomyces sp. SD31 TaxID=3452208 RepID=UPI003F8A23E3